MSTGEHRRRLDGNGHEIHERKTDSDYIARIGEFVARWKIMWAFVGGILAWYGKTVLEPLRVSAQTTAQVTLINTKIDKVIIPRLDSADADRARMIRVQETQTRQLGISLRFLCSRISPDQRIVIDVDCRDIPIATPQPKGGP